MNLLVWTFTVKIGTNKLKLVSNVMKDVPNGKISVSKSSNIAHNGMIRETVPHVRPDMETLNKNPSMAHVSNNKFLHKILKLKKPKPIKLKLHLLKDNPKLKQNNHPLQNRVLLWAHKIIRLNFHWLTSIVNATQKTENALIVSMGTTSISTQLAKSFRRTVLLPMKSENALHV